MKRSAVALLFVLCSGAPGFAEMLDQPPRAIELAPPRYPDSERKAQRGGLVTIVIRVDEKGTATIERVMGSGHPLTVAVRAAARSWKFEPARRQGRTPISEIIEYVVVFDPEKGVEILGPLYRA